jgi:SAM-dependent methyltransferase
VKDSTKRFSDRVDAYVRYRPGYPAELLEFMQSERLMAPGTEVADIGAGTGIFSRLLVEAGARVYAVEPNAPMRAALEATITANEPMMTVGGTAEATGLKDASVDLITAAQAFHWFDPAGAKAEFRRIARPHATAALIWNERQVSTPFLRDYDQLITEFAMDYQRVDHRLLITPEKIAEFFAPAMVHTHTFTLRQHFDLAGLRGRLLSSSYIPQNDTQGRFQEMIDALSGLFSRYQQGGIVTLDYITRLYYGRVHAEA